MLSATRHSSDVCRVTVLDSFLRYSKGRKIQSQWSLMRGQLPARTTGRKRYYHSISHLKILRLPSHRTPTPSLPAQHPSPSCSPWTFSRMPSSTVDQTRPSAPVGHSQFERGVARIRRNERIGEDNRPLHSSRAPRVQCQQRAA